MDPKNLPKTLALQIAKKICFKCKTNNKYSAVSCRRCKSSALRGTKNFKIYI